MMAQATKSHPSRHEFFSNSETRTIAVLEELHKASRPVGSGALYPVLTARGVVLAEATAGRLLRQLEQAGYVVQVGRRGRQITPKGRQWLRTLRNRRTQVTEAHEFARVIGDAAESELEDILVARRALEAEGTALAAVHATEEERKRLHELAGKSADPAPAGVRAGDRDIDFHLAVADASHNKVLATAVRLMRLLEPRFPVLAQIRRAWGEPIGLEHRRIAAAIAERDPKRARSLMVDHIDHALRDLRRWRGRGAARTRALDRRRATRPVPTLSISKASRA